MEVKIPQTVTIGQIATTLSIVGTICGIMGWFFAMYFGGIQNTKDINTVTNQSVTRSKEVDEKFSKIDDKVDELKIGVAEVKIDVNYTKQAMGTLSQQVSQFDRKIDNLTSLLLKEKVASYEKYADLNKVNYNPHKGE